VEKPLPFEDREKSCLNPSQVDISFQELENICSRKVKPFAKIRLLKFHMQQAGIDFKHLKTHQETIDKYYRLIESVKSEVSRMDTTLNRHDKEMIDLFQYIPEYVSYYIKPTVITESIILSRNLCNVAIVKKEVLLDCNVQCSVYSFSIVKKDMAQQIEVYVEVKGRPYGYYHEDPEHNERFLVIMTREKHIEVQLILEITIQKPLSN